MIWSYKTSVCLLCDNTNRWNCAPCIATWNWRNQSKTFPMNDEFTRIALKKDNLPFQTNSKTHPFHLNARPFVSSFGCQPLRKTCCLTSSPSNEPRVQRSTWQRCRLNICSYILVELTNTVFVNSTNLTTNIKTALLSKEHILQTGGKFSWLVQNDEKATETKDDYLLAC